MSRHRLHLSLSPRFVLPWLTWTALLLAAPACGSSELPAFANPPAPNAGDHSQQDADAGGEPDDG